MEVLRTNKEIALDRHSGDRYPECYKSLAELAEENRMLKALIKVYQPNINI